VSAGTRTLVVVGAHLRGQPLNAQLTSLGARFEEQTATAPAYRLHALDTDPPKPGLVRVATGGGPVEVEVWRLPEEGFARFVADVPPPLAIGSLELADGRVLPGFVCEPLALGGAPDITASGGWRAHRAGLTAG
jgi:allophanate hydrolase